MKTKLNLLIILPLISSGSFLLKGSRSQPVAVLLHTSMLVHFVLLSSYSDYLEVVQLLQDFGRVDTSVNCAFAGHSD